VRLQQVEFVTLRSIYTGLFTEVIKRTWKSRKHISDWSYGGSEWHKAEEIPSLGILKNNGITGQWSLVMDRNTCCQDYHFRAFQIGNEQFSTRSK